MLTVVPFSGRIGTRALKSGRCIARLTASNAKGNAKPITVRFTIVQKPAQWCIE